MAHCHVVRRAANPLQLADKNIAILEEKAKEFEKIVQTVDNVISIVVTAFNENVKPIVKEFQKELSAKTKEVS